MTDSQDKFSNWLNSEEQKLPNFLYTAAVLHKFSQDRLLGDARKWMLEYSGHDIPADWIIRTHHMTIKFKPSQADIDSIKQFLGKEVTLKVTNFAFDNYGAAVTVESNLPVSNAIPHITIAHSKEVGAVYSNQLLADKSKWHPIKQNVVAYVLGVTGNDGTYPDINPIPLAWPTV